MFPPPPLTNIHLIAATWEAMFQTISSKPLQQICSTLPIGSLLLSRPAMDWNLLSTRSLLWRWAPRELVRYTTKLKISKADSASWALCSRTPTLNPNLRRISRQVLKSLLKSSSYLRINFHLRMHKRDFNHQRCPITWRRLLQIWNLGFSLSSRANPRHKQSLKSANRLKISPRSSKILSRVSQFLPSTSNTCNSSILCRKRACFKWRLKLSNLSKIVRYSDPLKLRQHQI